MKKAAWLIPAMFVLALCSGVAVAHSLSATVAANIPFAFNVGNVQLPAGAYEIYPESDDGLNLMIRNTVTGKSVVTSTVTRIESRESGNAELVFDKVNDTCHLAEVRPADADGFLLKATSQKQTRVTVRSS